MRSELGVLLMEEETGEISVQLFSEIKGVESAFDNLRGNPAEKNRRATLLSLRFDPDGQVQVGSQTRLLPEVVSVEDKPDGYILGEGPVKFKK